MPVQVNCIFLQLTLHIFFQIYVGQIGEPTLYRFNVGNDVTMDYIATDADDIATAADDNPIMVISYIRIKQPWRLNLQRVLYCI